MHPLLTPTSITISLFGTSAFVLGLSSLLAPEMGLQSQSLPQEALPAYYGNALAAIGMGIYYNLAAYQGNRAFFALTVPMRLLTTVVFWSQGGMWKNAAVWEAGGAGLTGVALGWEVWGEGGGKEEGEGKGKGGGEGRKEK